MKGALALLVCLGTLPAQAEILTPEGLGAVHIGMRLAQVEHVLGHKLTLEDTDDKAACTTAERPDKHASFMFEGNKVTRIDVWRSDITTAEGAGIGSSESELRKLYGNRAIFTTHPYDSQGHYVTVKFPAANRALVFETVHGKVSTYRIGTLTATAYIEGCQ